MKILVINIFLVMFGWLILVFPAFSAPNIGLDGGGAANVIAKKGGYETVGVTDTTISESIGKIIKVALSFVGTLFFALTVYAGFLWMTASGNEEQVTKAQSIIKMAIIGLIITLASYGITVYVLTAIALSSRNTTCVGSNC